MRDAEGLDFDVVVVGGSIAGSATALQLLQNSRGCGCGMGRGCECAALDRSDAEGDSGEGSGGGGLRVLVIERQAEFGRRVGESTVELSTYFLTRVLGLTRHLNERHTVKQGFRYWFTNESARDMGGCTEMGGRYLSRIGSFQVDRVELDAEVLRRVEALGGEVWRPAAVRSLELEEGGRQTLTVKLGDEERTVTARWVVDGSGRQAMVARQRGEVTPLEGHPSAAVWARWKKTLDFDGQDTIERFPELGRGFFGTRHTATNHIMGDGWWAWVIPLKDGDTSVGVTWDQRLFKWPRTSGGGRGGTLGDQLRGVLETHPVGRALLENAELVESDVHVRRSLPYTCKTAAGDGFLLVGDASGFIDPFYSMGLDYLSMTSIPGVELILAERRGECIKQKLATHNDTIGKTIPRWFEAIFRDKYVYMGDFELMRVAFLVDIALYYFGIVMPPYKRGKATIKDGMFVAKPAIPFYWFMRWTNRRLAAIAASRRKRGTFGRRNAGRRMLVPGFAFDFSIPKATAKALFYIAKLELTEGWRCWRPRRAENGSLIVEDFSASPSPSAPIDESPLPTPG
ncbi:MAG: NAD(P)/FAD-dependent oxidoreductase [Planctomycetota bacterium]